MTRDLLAVTLFLIALVSTQASALDTKIRFKAFGSVASLPAHDLNRIDAGTPSLDMIADLRIMLRHQSGEFTFLLDHSTTLVAGDSFALSATQNALDQTPSNDDRRALDLTFGIEAGARHRSLHRLDRLAVQYRHGDWVATIGRQAVSWGSGQVFSPMDLFNPFAPTVVDQDYKAGDDLILVERLLGNGNDLQFLAVSRRDVAGHISGRAASVAAKWHSFVGESEIELLAARHFTDQVFAVSTRIPLGGALMRSDLVATRLENGPVKLSGVVNIDYSLVVADRLVYVAAEYYRNGFGVRDLSGGLAELPQPLQTRLVRGEVFNFMRDYGALVMSVPWHPLLGQSLSLILNLHDGSSLLQTSFSYEPSDHQRLQLGIVKSLGRAGDEFGGVPIAAHAPTVGGGARGFVRWLYFF